jgi:hypothetical protein
MGDNILNIESRHIFRAKNQDKQNRKNNNDNRVIVPAIVESVDDTAGYNRIKAQVVNLDKEGKIFSGTDWASSEDQMPPAVPLLPEYMHVRPQVGEMVFIIRENPNDPTSGRYWIGPIVSQQTKLKNQNFEQSNQAIFNRGSYRRPEVGGSPSTQNTDDAQRLLAKPDEVAVQGRGTGDLVIGEKFVRLRTGIFEEGSFKENTKFPCSIELKIVDQPPSSTGVNVADSQVNAGFEKYSQQNIIGTNINLISPEGIDRKTSEINQELSYNPRLKDFGEKPKTLHPAVLGDHLADLLSKIVKYLITHKHPPQSPPIPPTIAVGSEGTNLAAYSAKIVVSRFILSRVVRLN